MLWPLLYDSLAQPDASFTPQFGLASSIDVSGTTVTAHLKSGVKFWDGSALGAQDVVYSYNLVKSTPSSYFYSNVQNIASVAAQGSATVVFTLASPDALAQNLLDIPIIKSGSAATSGANAAYPNAPPTGSGPYQLSMAAVGGTLTLNKSWYGGGSFGFQTIAVNNIRNTDALDSSLKIGEINYLFTDYGQGAVSVPNIETKAVNLNRMVFLGVNSAHAGLGDAHVRRAVSLLIDRSGLVTDAFSSQALATNLPYNPDWAGGVKPQAADLSASSDKAAQELTQAGYTARNASGVYTKADGSAPLSLSLLYNSDDSRMATAARLLSQALTKAGIGVTAEGKAFDAYTQALQSGGFDLYLGDVALTDDMDLTPLLSPGAGASYGVAAGSATLAAFQAWRAGGQLAALTSAFQNELPFLPLCFKTGTVSYTPGLAGSVTPTARNIFYGIAGWHY